MHPNHRATRHHHYPWGLDKRRSVRRRESRKRNLARVVEANDGRSRPTSPSPSNHRAHLRLTTCFAAGRSRVNADSPIVEEGGANATVPVPLMDGSPKAAYGPEASTNFGRCATAGFKIPRNPCFRRLSMGRMQRFRCRGSEGEGPKSLKVPSLLATTRAAAIPENACGTVIQRGVERNQPTAVDRTQHIAARTRTLRPGGPATRTAPAAAHRDAAAAVAASDPATLGRPHRWSSIPGPGTKRVQVFPPTVATARQRATKLPPATPLRAALDAADSQRCRRC